MPSSPSSALHKTKPLFVFCCQHIYTSMHYEVTQPMMQTEMDKALCNVDSSFEFESKLVIGSHCKYSLLKDKILNQKMKCQLRLFTDGKLILYIRKAYLDQEIKHKQDFLHCVDPFFLDYSNKKSY